MKKNDLVTEIANEGILVKKRDISKVLSAMKQVALQRYAINEGFSFDDVLQNPYKKKIKQP